MLLSELKKNLWTELTPARLIIMPVSICAFFLFIYFVSKTPEALYKSMLNWSTIIIAVLLYLVGTRVASEAIIGEINSRTWINLRMTGIKVWHLWSSKLFLQNLYVWYGTAVAVIFYLIAAPETGDYFTNIKLLAIMLILGVFSHAITLLFSFIGLKQNKNGKLNSTMSFILGALITGAMLYYIFEFFSSNTETIRWHGTQIKYLNLSLISVLFFTFWAVVGVFRNIRIALSMHNSALLWLLFMFSVMVYFAGFVTYYNVFDSYEFLLLKRLISLIIAVVITYIMIFSEKISILGYKRFLHHAKSVKQISFFRWFFLLQKQIARWVYGWFVVFVLSIVTFVYFGYHSELGFMRTFINPYFPLLLMMFLTRDIIIVLILKLKSKFRKSEIIAGLILLSLYMLIPALLSFVGLFRFYYVFLPTPDPYATHWLVILIICIQLLLAIAILYHQWRKIQSEYNKSDMK